MTNRLSEIKNWLSSLEPKINLDSLQYLQSDASSRNYLRCDSELSTFIVMDTKPGEEMTRFSQVAKLLDAHKLTVPKIIASDLERGLLLLSDLGSRTYLQALKQADSSTVDRLYLEAITSIVTMQSIPSVNEHYTLPIMDATYISNRLDIFKTWYLQKHLNLEIDPKINTMIEKLQILFTTAFEELPLVFTHVDYHSRNLMVLEDGNPGILDFQDAMLGPVTYDLVSLFQDAYITYPRAMVESWIETYKDLAVTAGVLQGIPTNKLLRNFALVGLQRHIKNLGIFARLHYRDHKSNYLNDMPMLINYITDTCTRYDDLSWLLNFVKDNTLETSL